MNVLDSHEVKENEHQVRLDSTLAGIDRFTNENKDQKKLLQICDEREHAKEEIISLRTQLDEVRKIEEVMSSQLKEKEEQCGNIRGQDCFNHK